MTPLELAAKRLKDILSQLAQALRKAGNLDPLRADQQATILRLDELAVGVDVAAEMVTVLLPDDPASQPTDQGTAPRSLALLAAVKAIEADIAAFPATIILEAGGKEIRDAFDRHIDPLTRRLDAWLWFAVLLIDPPLTWTITTASAEGALGFRDGSIEATFGQPRE